MSLRASGKDATRVADVNADLMFNTLGMAELS